MKVQENIENYEIPDGFHLTADEEEQFASDLKDIVAALTPIRSSKLKTRKYFNSHLRYSSNVLEAQEKIALPGQTFKFGEGYTPLPEEYTWNSNLLQPALLDILKDDMYSFGFVVNYLDADLQNRENDHVLRYTPISDAAIKFSLAFDVEEIRAKAKSIPDLNERILYLNSKLTDYKIFDGLDHDEQEWIAAPVGDALEGPIY